MGFGSFLKKVKGFAQSDIGSSLLTAGATAAFGPTGGALTNMALTGNSEDGNLYSPLLGAGLSYLGQSQREGDISGINRQISGQIGQARAPLTPYSSLGLETAQLLQEMLQTPFGQTDEFRQMSEILQQDIDAGLAAKGKFFSTKGAEAGSRAKANLLSSGEARRLQGLTSLSGMGLRSAAGESSLISQQIPLQAQVKGLQSLNSPGTQGLIDLGKLLLKKGK